jgi:hypothetical protein
MWVMENSIVGRAAQSMWMTDFSDLSTWMMEFSATCMLCSCVTLGFCNSNSIHHTKIIVLSQQLFGWSFFL